MQPLQGRPRMFIINPENKYSSYFVEDKGQARKGHGCWRPSTDVKSAPEAHPSLACSFFSPFTYSPHPCLHYRSGCHQFSNLPGTHLPRALILYLPPSKCLASGIYGEERVQGDVAINRTSCPRLRHRLSLPAPFVF